MSILTIIASLMDTPNSEVTFKLTSAGGDNVRLLITPQLGQVPDDIGDKERSLRAALAQPIILKGTVETVEQELIEYMEYYKPVRGRAINALDALIEATDKAESCPAKKPQADIQKDEEGSTSTPDIQEEPSTPTEPTGDKTETSSDTESNPFGASL